MGGASKLQQAWLAAAAAAQCIARPTSPSRPTFFHPAVHHFRWHRLNHATAVSTSLHDPVHVCPEPHFPAACKMQSRHVCLHVTLLHAPLELNVFWPPPLARLPMQAPPSCGLPPWHQCSRRRPAAALPPLPPAALVPGGQSFKKGMAEYVWPAVMPSCCMPLPLGAGHGLTAPLRRWSELFSWFCRAGRRGQHAEALRAAGRTSLPMLLRTQGNAYSRHASQPAGGMLAAYLPTCTLLTLKHVPVAARIRKVIAPQLVLQGVRAAGRRGQPRQHWECHCRCKVSRLARLLACLPTSSVMPAVSCSPPFGAAPKTAAGGCHSGWAAG